METIVMGGLAWTVICGIWIFVGFGVRQSVRELARLSVGTSWAIQRRVGLREVARGLAMSRGG